MRVDSICCWSQMRGSGSSMCVNSTPIEEQYVSFRWLTISRSVARSGRPPMPAVEKVLSRSASLSPKCDSSSSGAARDGASRGSSCANRWPRTRYALTRCATRLCSSVAAMTVSRTASRYATARSTTEPRTTAAPLHRVAFPLPCGRVTRCRCRSRRRCRFRWCGAHPFFAGARRTPGRGRRGVGPLEEAAPVLFYGLWALKPARMKFLDVPRVDAELVEHVSPLLRRQSRHSSPRSPPSSARPRTRRSARWRTLPPGTRI